MPILSILSLGLNYLQSLLEECNLIVDNLVPESLLARDPTGLGSDQVYNYLKSYQDQVTEFARRSNENCRYFLNDFPTNQYTHNDVSCNIIRR